jgi:prepilin-type N-terminal cleavage/methylation domain-containing protein
MKKIQKKAGFSLVEVLIASAMISLTAFALIASTTKGLELSDRALNQVQANNLIEEGIEAIKTIRDTNWNNISNIQNNVDYYLNFDLNSNSWNLLTLINEENSIVDEIFYRKITFSSVERDANTDDIVSSGVIDGGGKRVNVEVKWLYKGDWISRNIVFYLFNIFN